jgi:hypothetical protein
MSAPLMLDAVALTDRAVAIVSIRDAIGEAGCLLDARAFSDLAMSFHFELESERALDFASTLRASDVVLSDASFARLAAAVGAQRGSAPLTIMMSVTFRRGSGELRNDVPEVPG